MAKVKSDAYDQFMGFSVLMSAANTLTFSPITVGVSIFEYAAFLVSRIEYNISRASAGELVTSADSITTSICGSDSITDIFDVRQPEVYDMHTAFPIGTGGGPFIYDVPKVHDFTTMKGGGLLIPAQNIYIGVVTAGFAAAGTATGRIYFTVKDLQAADFFELVQRLRVLTT